MHSFKKSNIGKISKKIVTWLSCYRNWKGTIFLWNYKQPWCSYLAVLWFASSRTVLLKTGSVLMFTCWGTASSTAVQMPACNSKYHFLNCAISVSDRKPVLINPRKLSYHLPHSFLKKKHMYFLPFNLLLWSNSNRNYLVVMGWIGMKIESTIMDDSMMDGLKSKIWCLHKIID